MLFDFDDYENGPHTRDLRIAGRFFIGVLTLGIYCCPVFPMRVPKSENVQLYSPLALVLCAGLIRYSEKQTISHAHSYGESVR